MTDTERARPTILYPELANSTQPTAKHAVRTASPTSAGTTSTPVIQSSTPMTRFGETNLSAMENIESGIKIPGTSSHFLEAGGLGDHGQGRLRYLTGGSGAPLVLLHTVRTQAEHFRHVIPLVQQRYTVYALDLPGMG